MPLRHPANLVPLYHLQADWLTPFDFAVHSYSGKEMKQTAAAVTCDELLQICQRKRLSLSLKKPNRFGACVTEQQQSTTVKGVVPVNTKVANDWALRNLRQWMDHLRNCGEEQVPEDLLQVTLNCLFCVFQLYNCFLLVFIFIFNDILH